LNEDQWNELRAGLIQNNQQLYVFYYKLNEEIQQKIEIIIKNYFFRKVFGFAPKYLPNNTVQMANVGVMNVPPHKYPELFVEVRILFEIMLIKNFVFNNSKRLKKNRQKISNRIQ